MCVCVCVCWETNKGWQIRQAGQPKETGALIKRSAVWDKTKQCSDKFLLLPVRLLLFLLLCLTYESGHSPPCSSERCGELLSSVQQFGTSCLSHVVLLSLELCDECSREQVTRRVNVKCWDVVPLERPNNYTPSIWYLVLSRSVWGCDFKTNLTFFGHLEIHFFHHWPSYRRLRQKSKHLRFHVVLDLTPVWRLVSVYCRIILLCSESLLWVFPSLWLNLQLNPVQTIESRWIKGRRKKAAVEC